MIKIIIMAIIIVIVIVQVVANNNDYYEHNINRSLMTWHNIRCMMIWHVQESVTSPMIQFPEYDLPIAKNEQTIWSELYLIQLDERIIPKMIVSKKK